MRIFLERQEPHVLSFCDEFSQLKVSDEKTDLLESFLQTLASDLEKDSIWHGKYYLYNTIIIIHSVNR